MNSYETSKFTDLADQLRRGPRRLRLRQLYGIDFLLSVIEDGKEYPHEFVLHAMTGYRSRSREDQHAAADVLDGETLRAELVLLAEDLSEDAELPLETWPQPLHTVNELAERLGVSTKTIFRWRRRGLVGWKFRCADARTRLAFPEHAIRRFVAENHDLVNRGASFSQLTKTERAAIIARAEALVAAGEQTVNSVARAISTERGRAIETIRLILKHHDEAHPRGGLFNRSPLGVDANDVRLPIWEAYVDGDTAARIAKRFGRTTREVYAIITEMRARELKSRKLEFVPSDEFDQEDCAAQIAADPALAAAVRRNDPHDGADAERGCPPTSSSSSAPPC